MQGSGGARGLPLEHVLRSSYGFLGESGRRLRVRRREAGAILFSTLELCEFEQNFNTFLSFHAGMNALQSSSKSLRFIFNSIFTMADKVKTLKTIDFNPSTGLIMLKSKVCPKIS